jgi:hypothetical protein
MRPHAGKYEAKGIETETFSGVPTVKRAGFRAYEYSAPIRERLDREMSRRSWIEGSILMM